MRLRAMVLIVGLAGLLTSGSVSQDMTEAEQQLRARTQVLIEEALAGSPGTSAYMSTQLADKFKAWARSRPEVVCSSYLVLADVDTLFLVERQRQCRQIRLEFIASGRYSDGRVRKRIQRMHIGPWQSQEQAMSLRLTLGRTPVWREGVMGAQVFSTQASTQTRFSMGATKPASTSVVTLDMVLPVGQTKTLVESLDAQEADQIMDFALAVVQGHQEDVLSFFLTRRQGLSWWQKEGTTITAGSSNAERFSMWKKWQLERPDAQHVILDYPDPLILSSRFKFRLSPGQSPKVVEILSYDVRQPVVRSRSGETKATSHIPLRQPTSEYQIMPLALLGGRDGSIVREMIELVRTGQSKAFYARVEVHYKQDRWWTQFRPVLLATAAADIRVETFVDGGDRRCLDVTWRNQQAVGGWDSFVIRGVPPPE